MANKSIDPRNNDDLNSLAKLLSRKKWTLEDYQPFVGFGQFCEDIYSSGKNGNFRCGISDESVVYKYSTGSRHIVHFDTNEEAKAFWDKYVGLDVFKSDIVKNHTFKKNDVLRINTDTVQMHDNFVSPKGKLVMYKGTFNNEKSTGLDIYVVAIDEIRFDFKDSTEIAQAFGISINDVELVDEITAKQVKQQLL